MVAQPSSRQREAFSTVAVIVAGCLGTVIKNERSAAILRVVSLITSIEPWPRGTD